MKASRNIRLKTVLLRHLKSRLREFGLAPPYLGELRRRELLKWMDEYVSDDEFDRLVSSLVREES